MPSLARRVLLAGTVAALAAGCARLPFPGLTRADALPANANIVVAAGDGAVGLAYKPGLLPVVVARAQGPGAGELVGAARGRNLPVAVDAGATARLLREGQVGAPIPEPLFRPVARAFKSVGFRG